MLPSMWVHPRAVQRVPLPNFGDKHMTRTEYRKAQRTRIAAEQSVIAKKLGLPKGLFQFAKRHGVLPEQIRNERLKYPY
jgi:hypothetical protein